MTSLAGPAAAVTPPKPRMTWTGRALSALPVLAMLGSSGVELRTTLSEVRVLFGEHP